jgi:hypothetical protein
MGELGGEGMTEKIKLLEKLRQIDKEFVEHLDDCPLDIENNNVIEKLSLDNFKQEQKAVLGLDIYKYSTFPDDKQNLIPFVFDIIKDEATKYINQVEPTFFSNDYKHNFISTGDGGFLIFSTPLHALIFNLYFYAALQLFNTGHFFPKLSQYIGEIIVRSTITYDNIYFYENNCFGKGVITNARILRRDKLNRFLIDKKVYNYFIKYFDGLETLPILTKNHVKRVLKIESEINSWFIFKENDSNDGNFFSNDRVRNIHIQKIDDLIEKDTQLTIYNVEIQIAVDIRDDNNPNKRTIFILSIGNTNALR